jgi:hypothetical protein
MSGTTRAAGSRQRLYEFPIQESPGGIAVQENNGVAGSLIDVVHAPAIDTLKSRLVWPFLMDKVLGPHGLPCCIEIHSPSPYERLGSWKEDHGLAVQAGQPRNGTEAISSLKIQRRRLRLGPHNRAGHAFQSASPAASETATTSRNKHPHETPVSMIIFTDRRYRICCTERVLAAHDDIAALARS